jgi:type IV pilus assembly protein PilM
MPGAIRHQQGLLLKPMAKRVNKPLVGLDIEPSAVTAAQVSVNGSIRIDRAAIVPLEPGVVRDGEVVDVEGLSDALKTLYRDNKGLGKRVRLGIANAKIVVRTIELPPISDRKEFETAVRFKAQDEIPMPLDAAVLDFQALDIVDTPEGPRQRILLVAARRDMVDKVIAAARAAGLRPEGIDLAAFAMIRALQRPGPEEPVMYLSVGGLTNLAVAIGSRCLFTRVVGGGSEALAIELAERNALTLEHARAWLEHVGLRAPVQEISGDESIVSEARLVLQDGVRRIAVEARNSLDFHSAQDDTPYVERVVMTGAALSIPGFADALGAELGLPVEAVTVAGAPEEIGAGRLSVAAGLAIAEGPHA